MSRNQGQSDDGSLSERIRRNAVPAAWWLAGFVVLVGVEFGALASLLMSVPWGSAVNAITSVLPGPLASAVTTIAAVLASVGGHLADVPTLLSRDLVPNQGYHTPDGGWQGTFLGLSPAVSWGIRVALVYAYGFGFVWWVWRGYLVYRRHYRRARWTPMDDVVNRLRRHRWGQFGFLVVAAFLLMAVFAPALGPTTVEQNILDPYSHEIQVYDAESGTVEEMIVGTANLDSVSRGEKHNVGIGEYDRFDRFHPFGTLTTGKDLFTFMVHGARVSMFIGLVAITISSVIAMALALLSAYYKGLFDLAAVFISDSVSAMPGLLALVMLSVVLSNTWIAKIYSGGLLLALIFGGLGWTGLWRAIRGPALQIAENEWIDAAESFGQKPRVIVRKHIAPYVIGYLLIYASMSIGGIIIGTAGLSYLGIGISSPTPEWGRAISMGQQYITSPSWHISILPGIAVTIVVVGFNALGDGIRDAIDPQSDGATTEEVAVSAGSGA